jgi:hypothetical protein
MHAEAQITPLVLTFPPEVIERAAAYAKDHSMVFSSRSQLTLLALGMTSRELADVVKSF